MWTFHRTYHAPKRTLGAGTAGPSSTPMVCSHINHEYHELAPRGSAHSRLHPGTSGPRLEQRWREISASPPMAATFGSADVSVRGRGLFHFRLCVFPNSVPAPAGITQTQEDHMSPGGQYICKSVDNSPVTAALIDFLFVFFFTSQ